MSCNESILASQESLSFIKYFFVCVCSFKVEFLVDIVFVGNLIVTKKVDSQQFECDAKCILCTGAIVHIVNKCFEE